MTHLDGGPPPRTDPPCRKCPTSGCACYCGPLPPNRARLNPPRGHQTRNHNGNPRITLTLPDPSTRQVPAEHPHKNQPVPITLGRTATRHIRGLTTPTDGPPRGAQSKKLTTKGTEGQAHQSRTTTGREPYYFNDRDTNGPGSTPPPYVTPDGAA